MLSINPKTALPCYNKKDHFLCPIKKFERAKKNSEKILKWATLKVSFLYFLSYELEVNKKAKSKLKKFFKPF